MAENKSLAGVIALIRAAIAAKQTINQYCLSIDKPRNTVANALYSLDEKLKKKLISRADYDEVTAVYNQYLDVKDTWNNEVEVKVEELVEREEDVEYDATADEDYDDRSVGICERGPDEKITHYTYKIFIRDKESLEGSFSREEMDTVYRLYSSLDGAGLTVRDVSRQFPALTYRDFKRILRAFNITKSSMPVAPHILEEKNANDVAELVLKRKEDNLYKKLDSERGKHYEKSYRDSMKKIVEIRSNDTYIEDIVKKYIAQRPALVPQVGKRNSTVLGDGVGTMFAVFGDIHYGKKFDRPVFGRGYNKIIAHERVMQIAQEIVDQANTKGVEEICMIWLGDLVESVLEDGMHPNHTAEMDLYMEEQVFFAVDSLKEMVLYVAENTNCKIDIHSIHGNHDRVGLGRADDKNRTSGRIISTIIKRELEQERIQVNIPLNNLVKIVKGKVCIFAQHGDASLSKKQPSELVNLYGEPGCYSVLIQGHWHNMNAREGTNFTAIKAPSVASTDKYCLEELGNNSLPGFIIGWQPSNCYGFDYSKLTLY